LEAGLFPGVGRAGGRGPGGIPPAGCPRAAGRAPPGGPPGLGRSRPAGPGVPWPGSCGRDPPAPMGFCPPWGPLPPGSNPPTAGTVPTRKAWAFPFLGDKRLSGPGGTKGLGKSPWQKQVEGPAGRSPPGVWGSGRPGGKNRWIAGWPSPPGRPRPAFGLAPGGGPDGCPGDGVPAGPPRPGRSGEIQREAVLPSPGVGFQTVSNVAGAPERTERRSISRSRGPANRGKTGAFSPQRDQWGPARLLPPRGLPTGQPVPGAPGWVLEDIGPRPIFQFGFSDRVAKLGKAGFNHFGKKWLPFSWGNPASSRVRDPRPAPPKKGRGPVPGQFRAPARARVWDRGLD